MLSAAFALLRTFRGTSLRDFRRFLADWLFILLTSAFCDFAVLVRFGRWERAQLSVMVAAEGSIRLVLEWK